MKLGKNTYKTLRNIHLYAALSTIVFFLMYLISSYIMMHHDTFEKKEVAHETLDLAITSGITEEGNWKLFLSEQHIKGRQTRDQTKENGQRIIEYRSPGQFHKITLSADKDSLQLEQVRYNFNGVMNDLHRTKGYDGPLSFKLYGFMLDVMAISLIVFVFTGIILWLQLLKDKRIGWLILFLGFCYVSVTMYYLMR